jgi:hypothetical protein
MGKGEGRIEPNHTMQEAWPSINRSTLSGVHRCLIFCCVCDAEFLDIWIEEGLYLKKKCHGILGYFYIVSVVQQLLGGLFKFSCCHNKKLCDFSDTVLNLTVFTIFVVQTNHKMICFSFYF